MKFVILLVGCLAASCARPAVVVSPIVRVNAAAIHPTPVPPPPPAPTAAPRPVVAKASRPKLAWVPKVDAGPWPTNGHVEMPTLGRTAPIVRVGVDSKGAMVVPKNAKDVAWLDQGPYPGVTNNVVLAGHIAYSRVDGSFSQIGRLQPGEHVVVEMDAVRYTYAVTWVRDYPWNTDQAAEILGPTDVSSVTMVTCAGTFNKKTGTRSSRTVVRAELVPS